MPALPKFPKVGQTVVAFFSREDFDAILAAASPQAKLAFALGGFGGLERARCALSSGRM
jgi:hypothetical protein